MSTSSNIAEHGDITAEWVMGTPETQEVALIATADDDALLSGNVRHGEEDQEYPWYVTFYDYDEGMGFDEVGFNTREEAMLAAETYFDEEGYDVDKASRAEAVIDLGEAMNGGKISKSQAELLARVALRCDQGLYNVRTGLTLCPDVNDEGELFGLQIATTPLSALMEAGGAGLPEDAFDYAMAHYPAYGTLASNRMGGISEQNDDIKDVHQQPINRDSCTVLDEMVEQMTEDGSGWCFTDQYSIAAECGMVPDRYTTFSYRPDNAEPDEELLGWGDFLEAADGNAAYAMCLVDRSDGLYPSSMVEDDLRCNEITIVDGKAFMTYGFELQEDDLQAANEALPAKRASGIDKESDSPKHEAHPERVAPPVEHDAASRDEIDVEAR